MAKVNLNKLPLFCGNQLTIFRTLSSIHTYVTRSAFSKSFYVQITSLVKTNQSFKISCVKIWTSVPRHIRDKVLTSSDKTSSEILKLYFWNLIPVDKWNHYLLAEVESRTQGSRPRPRTQKKSEAKDSLSEDRHSRGQGQEWSRPRTGMIEAKAKDQGHKRKCSTKKKRSPQKFFKAISKKTKKKVFTKIFQAISTKKRFPKNFSSAPQNFNNSKNNAVLEPRTGQFSRTWGLEAKDLTFEAKAKDFKCVLEDSTSVY